MDKVVIISAVILMCSPTHSQPHVSVLHSLSSSSSSSSSSLSSSSAAYSSSSSSSPPPPSPPLPLSLLLLLLPLLLLFLHPRILSLPLLLFQLLPQWSLALARTAAVKCLCLRSCFIITLEVVTIRLQEYSSSSCQY